jgi:hypothetical protein
LPRPDDGVSWAFLRIVEDPKTIWNWSLADYDRREAPVVGTVRSFGACCSAPLPQIDTELRTTARRETPRRSAERGSAAFVTR